VTASLHDEKGKLLILVNTVVAFGVIPAIGVNSLDRSLTR
jgi:hypothetical protein